MIWSKSSTSVGSSSRAGAFAVLCRACFGWALLAVPVVALSQPASLGSAAPTFAEIAPIVFAHCAPCHRPDAVAPFSLLSYDDVRQRANRIAEVTAQRLMPPWKPIDGEGGPFLGSRRLSDVDVLRFRQWADAGAPLGDPNQVPPPPTWPSGWRLGVPDVVVTMPEPYVMPADGLDRFRNFVLPIPTDQPRFVSGFEFRPGNTRIAHHANIRIDQTRRSRELDAQESEPGYEGPLSAQARYPSGHFLGWTPGQLPPLAEPGMAWVLAPNSDFVIQLHMQPSGEVESLQASVGLYFTEDPPDRLPMMLRLGRQNIDIPPGQSQYVIRDRFQLPVDVELIGVQPHAHFRATDIKGVVTFPDGRNDWLIHIPEWDFDWQDVYRYEARRLLPKGTTVSMEYTYDNSAANPRNPDRPPRRVKFGQLSSDEMGDLWLQLLPRTEADRQLLIRSVMPKVINEDIVGYESMISVDPDNAVLHRDVAVLYLSVNRSAAAIQHYERSLALDPGSETAHYNLGILFAEQGQLEDARRHLRRAVALRPDHGEAHNNLGAILLSLGATEEAIPHLRQAVSLERSNAAAHNNLGQALVSTGQVTAAVEEFGLALEIDPEMVDAHQNLGNALAVTGDRRGAIRHQRRALELAPGAVASMTAVAWLLATDNEVTLGAAEEAIELAERATALTNRQSAMVLDALAASYAAAGRFQEAVETQQRAVELAEVAGASGTVSELRRRLALYQRGRPFRIG